MLKLKKWVKKGEKKVNHKQEERKKVSPDEEERQKEFVCWMMEPVQKQKTGEPTAMDTSESEEEPRRKVRLKRQRSPARGNWKEEFVLGEK